MKLIAVNVNEQYQNLQYNVAIIGWLGDIIASITLLCSALALHYRLFIVEGLIHLLQLSDEQEGYDLRTCLLNIVGICSIVSYALSIIDLLACTLLLVGIARNSSMLLFPWLLYHSILLGIGTHLALYIIICCLFVNFTVFATGLMVFTMALIIVFKIFHEVYMLFKCMHLHNNEKKHPLTVSSNIPCNSINALGNPNLHSGLYMLKSSDLQV